MNSRGLVFDSNRVNSLVLKVLENRKCSVFRRRIFKFSLFSCFSLRCRSNETEEEKMGIPFTVAEARNVYSLFLATSSFNESSSETPKNISFFLKCWLRIMSIISPLEFSVLLRKKGGIGTDFPIFSLHF